MMKILAIAVISIALIGIATCDCNQKLFDRAMKTGRNSVEQCSDAAISTLTFTGHEPGQYGDPKNATYHQYYISGDANTYTATPVINGSELGPVYATVTRKARVEGGDLITLVIGGKTFKAILQPSVLSVDSGVFVLRTICRNAVAYGISPDWSSFLNGSIKLALNPNESMSSKAQLFTLTPI
jgi:hypothetical protein